MVGTLRNNDVNETTDNITLNHIHMINYDVIQYNLRKLKPIYICSSLIPKKRNETIENITLKSRCRWWITV